MCNLYRVKSTAAEAADLFNIRPGDILPFNAAQDVYPKYTGMVIREVEGRRVLDAMTWGFPRHAKSKKTGLPLKPSPVNNARDDKLLNPFWPWKESFEQRRCLIPVTAWAEAEGEKGRMTATWYSLPDADLFSVGGVWRSTDEWGDAYSMVMVDGSLQMADVHDRMPVILLPDQREQWLRGTVDDALALTRTYEGLLAVERSADLWGKA
jgi:putative SOS response-associated peptidase YedK